MNQAGRVSRRLAALQKLSNTIGFLATLEWSLIYISHILHFYEPLRWHVRPHHTDKKLAMRLRNSSDMSVFKQIFVEQEYACLREIRDVSLVLDLGANVGYSTAWFLNCFPHAHVLAVEPDDRNILVCADNLKPYGERVQLLHGAVWERCTKLRLLKGHFGDGREWATQVVPPEDESQNQIQAWDIYSLLHMTGAPVIDLLKIDIERSELVVFGQTAEKWLPYVRNLCIELHGDDCKDVFFNALTGYEYELEHSGELTICRNLHPSETLAA